VSYYHLWLDHPLTMVHSYNGSFWIYSFNSLNYHLLCSPCSTIDSHPVYSISNMDLSISLSHPKIPSISSSCYYLIFYFHWLHWSIYNYNYLLYLDSHQPPSYLNYHIYYNSINQCPLLNHIHSISSFNSNHLDYSNSNQIY